MSAQSEFYKLVVYLGTTSNGIEGQMFGKKCIKINGKAGVALFNEYIVFKLTGCKHKEAISLTGSVLWDPSGKGRNMKEWVQITLNHKDKFKEFAKASANYVG